MYSQRLPWQAATNALARLTEEKRAEGAELLDLTSSNPTRVGFSYPEEVYACLADPRSLEYYPDPQGDRFARQAIALYYRRRGRIADTDRLILTASTSEAYSWLFKLLCEPGDAVLVPRPSYPLFDFLAALDSVEVHPYALGFDGSWYLDLAELRRAAALPRVRAILIVNPNNPTGSFLSRAELDALCAVAAEYRLPIVVDEVFSDYAFAPDPERVDSLIEESRVLTFCLSGLSKVVGLPQYKLGWIHVGGPRAEAAPALSRLELIADTYLSVSTPIALATPELLAMQPSLGGAIAGRIAVNLTELRQAVQGTSLGLLPVQGGWYATVRLPRTRTDEEWALKLLADDDLLVQPGYFFDYPAESYLVISLITQPGLLREGVWRMVARVESSA